jgi:hypothetical protein
LREVLTDVSAYSL